MLPAQLSPIPARLTSAPIFRPACLRARMAPKATVSVTQTTPSSAGQQASSSFMQRSPSSIVKAVQQMRGSASPSSPAAFNASCTPSRRCTPVAWSRSVPPMYTMCLRPCSSIRWASSRAAPRSSLYTQATSGKRWPVTTSGTRQALKARAS